MGAGRPAFKGAAPQGGKGRALKHQDLGVLDGPLLLFGGPYSNAQATEALLAVAARRAVPSARMICTGDVVAYCAQPAETVAAVREAGVEVVAGNCDSAVCARGAAG